MTGLTAFVTDTSIRLPFSTRCFTRNSAFCGHLQCARTPPREPVIPLASPFLSHLSASIISAPGERLVKVAWALLAPKSALSSGDSLYDLPIRMETPAPSTAPTVEAERLAYSVQESADLLGVDYFSVYRLIQRGKLRACRALRGKLLVPRSELLRLLKG